MVRLVHLALLVVPVSALAQGGTPRDASAAHDGAFVVRLGADTVLVERFARTGDVYSVERAFRSPQPSLYHAHVELAPGGEVRGVDYMLHRIGSPPDAPLLGRTRVSVSGDSATIAPTRGDSVLPTRRVAAPAGALPGLPLSPFTLELAAMRLVAARQDSLRIRSLGPLGVMPHTITRLGPDSVIFLYDRFNTWRARIDADGRVLGMRAPGSTFQVTIERVPSVDVGAYAARWAQAPATGVYSPRDSVRATVGGATLAVHYSRPSKRGRVVFGDSGVAMEPWGKVWRTGANEATRFTTDRDVVIGGADGLTVPAGTYTLWTLLDRAGWTLIVSRQILRSDGSGRPQWGTLYDAQHDVGRIAMAMTRLATPAEQMTIALEPAGAGAADLKIMWDTTQGSVPLRVK